MVADQGVSSLALLVSLIDRPAETLRQVAATPRRRWVLPLLLSLASIGVFLGLAAPYMQKMAEQAARLQLSTMPPEQAAAAEQQIARFTSLPMIVGSGAVTSVIGVLLSWVIAAAILYFSCLIAGEDLTFEQMIAIAPWLWLPFALQGFVQAAWVAATGQMITAPGLSALVASGNQMQDARSIPFALLSRIDLFAAWHIVLVYAGLRGLTHMRAPKAVTLTAIYAILSLAIRLIPTLIGRAFTPG